MEERLELEATIEVSILAETLRKWHFHKLVYKL